MHNIPDFLKISSEMQEHFAKGGMIKRADGSYSRRGLWDNIRANKGSGRKPTKEMLEQEAKIRAQEQYGGVVDEYGNGGYTVKRSSARKGKTHVVIGPDGTKKYFGDSKLGQHPKDPARKKAFYARHKHNLDNNPYFRAFARATWKDGGEIPMYASGTASVDPSQLNQDQLTNWNRFQYYASKNANITDPAYNTNRQMGYDLLNQYNQANPNNQVPVDTIPTYQAYFQKLQAGQTNVGQAGQEYVQKNFTQGVSPTDAFIGTQTLGSRVPMRGKKTVTNANTGQVVYNSGARPSTALPTPTPSQPVAQTNVPVPGMQTATLAYGGYYKDGGTYGPFYNRRDAAKMQRWRNPMASSMTPSFFAMGGLNQYQDGDTVIIDPYRTPTRTFTPPASNYPMYEMDMRGTENRWADRQPLEGMQTPPVIPANPTAPVVAVAPKQVETPTQPTTVAEDKSNLSQEIKQNAAEFKKPELSKKERKQQELEERIKNRASVEKMEEVPMSIRNSELTLNNQIPTSLIKAAPVTKSYLENTYESTEGIPKTVLQFFDTKGFNPANKEDSEKVRGKVIFDQTTNKAYTREYNPETGKFKIISAPIANDDYTKNALLRDVGAYSDDYTHSFAAYAAEKGQDNSMCAHGECMPDDSGEIHFYNERHPEGNNNFMFANVDEIPTSMGKSSTSGAEINDFITVNSGKSFDENIELMKQTNRDVYDYQKVKSRVNSEDFENATEKLQSQLKRSLTEEEKSQLKASMLQRQQNVPYNENVVRIPSHEEIQYYLPEFQDEYDPRYEERKRNEYRKYYTPSQPSNQETGEEQRKFGGRIYKRGGSIRRFDVGGDNPFENQMSSQNEFESTYNPYSVNPWATGQPQQSVAGNPFQNQLNTQNQAAVTGSPYNTTVPQTANNGQGINNPLSINNQNQVNTVGSPYATKLPAAEPMQTYPVGQNVLANATTNASQALIDRKNSIKDGLKQGYNKFKNPTANTPATATADNTDNTKTANTPGSKEQPSLSQSIAQMNHGLNGTAVTSGDTAVVDQGLQDYFNSKDHKFLQGIDQVQTGIGNLAKTISSINPNSQNAAVLGFDRQMNNTLTNRMTIAAPRKGIEYAKYGGKTSLKEGEELDLTTEQIHQLEKLGYKFQIL